MVSLGLVEVTVSFGEPHTILFHALTLPHAIILDSTFLVESGCDTSSLIGNELLYSAI